MNAGKTFSDQEAMLMAKNNQRLLSKMIKIQTSKADTIGGYSTTVTRGSAVTNHSSSYGLNRKKRGKKVRSVARSEKTRVGAREKRRSVLRELLAICDSGEAVPYTLLSRRRFPPTTRSSSSASTTSAVLILHFPTS